MKNAFVFALISLALAGPSAAQEEITILDPDFSSWTPFSLVVDDPNAAGPGPGTSTASVTRVATGGNPAAYLQFFHTIVFGDILYSGGIQGTFVYDPRVAGSIEEISLTADLFHPDPGGTAWQLVVEQSGTRYFSFPLNIFSQDDWDAVELESLTAASFDTNPLAGFSGVAPDGIRPDFSGTAAPLTFGMAFGNAVTAGVGNNTIRLDNFLLEISAVPEPSNALLMGIGLPGLIAFARWYRGSRRNSRLPA
jgi:hypothetical protein